MSDNKNYARVEKYKTITTEVFALTLGLGAFSLTTIPIVSENDIIMSIGAFAIAFFYIVIIWVFHSQFFENYPLFDDTFIVLNFVILFLVAVSPYLLQIMFTISEIQNLISIYYALDMIGVYIILAYFHHKYLKQNDDITPENKREIIVNRNIQLITVFWFLISIFVPINYRFTFWWFMPPLIPIYRIFIAPRHIKI